MGDTILCWEAKLIQPSEVQECGKQKLKKIWHLAFYPIISVIQNKCKA